MKKLNKKKIGIVTIIDNENCGNRLQNYALQEVLKKLGYDAITLKNDKLLNSKKNFILNYCRYIKKQVTQLKKVNSEKSNKFKEFNRLIKFSKRKITCFSKRINRKYEFFIAGSDQIWKPTRKRMSYIDLLGFASPEKRVSYAASFGLEKIDDKYNYMLKRELPLFKAISVREDAGKSIILKATGIENVEVVLDPTMLLNANEWELLEQKPKEIKKNKIIFTYFLGDEDINTIEEKYSNTEYQIIDFYKNNFGPKEFIYLIHHSDLILTDSFHAAVFSIIFRKNFYVFNRKQTVVNNNMNSRIETLLNTFNIKNRMIEGIDDINYSDNDYEIDEIMKKRQNESMKFIEKALGYSII